MPYLITFAVSEFPPFEQTDVNQLAEENLAYEHVDWALIAEVSAEIVESEPEAEGDPTSWLAAGRVAGLNDQELWAFDSLLAHPIDVARGEWTNGRHRGLAITHAGAQRVAVLHPNWRPEDVRDNRSGG